MPWVRIDDQFADHPKIIDVGTIGLAVQVRALCYCARYLTDGFLKESVGNLLTNPLDLPPQDPLSDLDPRPLIEKMVASGLWEKVKGGYMVHDYLKYNPSRKQVLDGREKDLQRKKPSVRIPDGVRSESSAPVPVPQVNHVLSSVVVLPASKPTNVVLLQGDVQKFWEAYPPRGRVRSSQKTVKAAWTDLRPSPELAAKILAGLESAKRSRDWLKEAGQFVPAAHRWLKNHGWEGHEAPQGSRASTTDEYGVRTMLLR